MTTAAPTTVDDPQRFAFGANWQRYLAHLTDERMAAATASLTRFFGPEGLQGKRFLDIGCGSGVFSLAAYRLGAQVHSFDYDPDSVACALELRRREGAAEDRWTVEQGSVLDGTFMEQLGHFDVVYSWGVLHHTGDMWTAIDLASQRVAPGGQLWIAIYNDQGVWSRIWRGIKQVYLKLPNWLRPAYVVIVGGGWLAQRALVRIMLKMGGAVLRLLQLKSPWKSLNGRGPAWAASQRQRGMHIWHDLVDWIGGYPFEVATPEQIFRFLRDRGFQLVDMTTCGGGLGCNEFWLKKTS